MTREKRTRKFLLIQFSLLLLVSLLLAFMVFFPKKVTVEIHENQTLAENPTIITIDRVVPSKTVGSILEENNINPESEYVYSPDLDKNIINKSKITVSRKVPVTLIIDGEETNEESGNETVGELLERLNIEFKPSDLINPDLDTLITQETSNIEVKHSIISEEVRQESIPYKTEETLDSSLSEDKVIIDQAGVEGLVEIKEKVTTRDGVEIKREVLSQETITEPVTEIKRVGINSYQTVNPVESTTSDLGIPNTTRRADGSLDTTSNDSYARVVNSNQPLPLDYRPTDLVNLGNDQYLRLAAADAFNKMKDQIRQDLGVEINPLSGYRPYDTQGSISGDSMTASAGYSEHQTGLAIDIGIPGTTDLDIASVSGSNVYQWMLANAHRYGYELSMPQNTYWVSFEPWHWRFVGVDLATNIREAQNTGQCIQFDDYITKVGK